MTERRIVGGLFAAVASLALVMWWCGCGSETVDCADLPETLIPICEASQ